MEKKVLGRGLSALISENIIEKLESAPSAQEIVRVRTELVKPCPYQPRLEFNSAKQEELIASIREKGILQPIIIRKVADGYEVIAGERRLRAAKSLNLPEIPAVVRNVSDEEAMVISIMENIQREELNAIDEAKAFFRLINEFNLTQDSVAQSVGKDRSTVSNLLRLLKLPAEIQKSIAEGQINMGHARALLSIETLSGQLKLFNNILEGNLSVRAVENLVKNQTRHRRPARRLAKDTNKDPFVASFEEQLQHHLGTKVRILHQRKRGKVVIEYYSNEDLERIVGLIKK